jgi:hypothetical protein
MRLFWGILGLLLLALPIRADALYDVTGTITLTGNDTCNGRCIETIDFSFQFDEQPYPSGSGFEALLANDLSITFSGPLVASYTGDAAFRDSFRYIGFLLGTSAASEDVTYPYTEYDLGVDSEGATYPFTPSFGGYLYSCVAPDGCYGFCPYISSVETMSACSNDEGTAGTQTIKETVTPESPVSTPEPQTWAMLWFGLIGLAVMKFAPREKRLKTWLPLVLAAETFPKAQPGHL